MSLNKFSFLLIAVLLIGCSDEVKDCDCLNDNEVLIQETSNNNLVTQLSRVDHGAYGYNVTLKVCDISKKLIEEIGLRGEDYLPTVDSIVDKNIYIHYSFPSRKHIGPIEGDLAFESVVLGSARTNRENLRFNYIFNNRK